jgi:CRP/FNR family transcriptional regulator
MPKEQHFRQLAFFRELDDSEFAQLQEIMQTRSYSHGTLLFLQGDPAVGFYLLLCGRIRIYKASPDGREFTLHQVQPGQLFAEAAIFRGKSYPANAIAEEDSEAIFLPKQEFLELITRSPQISVKIIISLAAWLREFAEKLENLSLREVPQRLASYLLSLSSRSQALEITLSVSKAQLASELGTISETLSRSLKKLKDSGAITVNGKRIHIVKPDLLAEIAAGEKV